MKILIIFSVIMTFSFGVMAEETKKRKIVTTLKTQSVDFDGETVDGKSRQPDGAYLVQKRSVDFVPLYKVREHFDESIRSSLEYLK
jgi:hypothetical protein